MKEFEVTITETLQKAVRVEASTKEEAQQLVEEMWNAGDVVLDADHFIGADFTCDDGREVQKETSMEVLLVEPGQYARMATISTGLAAMQAVVGGDIQAVYPFDDPVAIVCDDEGKLNGKPLNRALRDEDGTVCDIVAGTFFVCGLGEEDFASLPKELQKKYADKFRKPEAFLKMGRSIKVVPIEPKEPTGKGEKRVSGMEL